MTFHEWLTSRGIEWPNLGVNMPAGMDNAAANMLAHEMRLWKDSQRQFTKLIGEVLNAPQCQRMGQEAQGRYIDCWPRK